MRIISLILRNCLGFFRFSLSFELFVSLESISYYPLERIIKTSELTDKHHKVLQSKLLIIRAETVIQGDLKKMLRKLITTYYDLERLNTISGDLKKWQEMLLQPSAHKADLDLRINDEKLL